MACERDHIREMSDEVLKAIEDLPDSQKGTVRHRCPACAYLLGYAHGLKDGEDRALNTLIAAEGAKR